jgi:hypothetical protein
MVDTFRWMAGSVRQQLTQRTPQHEAGNLRSSLGLHPICSDTDYKDQPLDAGVSKALALIDILASTWISLPTCLRGSSKSQRVL